MDFIHPYSSMQLGAALEIDGQTHEVLRVKKRDNSLLGTTGEALGEALLHGGLRGLDRSSYAAMFSLNRQTLDEGGESILASKGDLGELLFQASAGLTDLAVQLDELRAEFEKFLNVTGRKGELRDLGAANDELIRQIKELDTAAADYARLSHEHDLAKENWTKARAAVETAHTNTSETDRQIESLPLLRRLDNLEKQIASFGALPEAPLGWLDELPELDRAETAISTQLETAEKTVEGLVKELSELPSDKVVLNAREDIEAAEQLKSAYDTAVEDLPKRRGELEAKKEDVNDCQSRLGQAGVEPSKLLPEARTMGRLRALIEQSSGVETAFQAATKEMQLAKEDLERAERRLRESGGKVADMGGLAGLVQNLRRDDLVGTYTRLKAELEDADARLKADLLALSPWKGNYEDLAQVAQPNGAALNQLEAEIAEAEKAANRANDQLEQAQLSFDQALARHDGIETTTMFSLEEAAQARARREAEWSRHRSNLTDETAEHFEVAMRLDDQVNATLADQRAHAEKTAAAARVLNEAQKQVDALKEHSVEARALCEGLAQKLADIVCAVSPALPVDIDLPTFRAWLTKLDETQTALELRNKKERQLANQTQAIEQARVDIGSALAQAGRGIPQETSLILAIETAQTLLDRVSKVQALSESVTEARQNLTRREESKLSAEGALEKWRSDWKAACAETWMADNPPNVEEMRAILEELDHMRDLQSRISELTHRTTTMQSNRDRFEKAVLDLSRQLDMPTDIPVSETWRNIIRRQRLADQQENSRADLARRLVTARETLQATKEKSELHSNRTIEFSRHFGVESWSETREALSRSGELSKLHVQKQETADDLCARMRCETIEEARDQLQNLNEDVLKAHADSLQSDLISLRKAQEEAQDVFRKVEEQVEAVGGDDAVARLEEKRQTLLLQIEEGARRHLQRRLGLLAVEAALKRYRDTHRSGMLQRASEAFRIMSRDNYSGLTSQPDGHREVLVALMAGGGSKHANQLSDGARSQLYLALRIAGYHEFARNNGPVPFIADDIMESFDDSRTSEAFNLMAEMGQTGQVIYLTHHAHLCEIARNACPSVFVHELEA